MPGSSLLQNPNADLGKMQKYLAYSKKLANQMEAVLKGSRDPEKVLKLLQDQWMRVVQQSLNHQVANIKGAKLLPIKYRTLSGEIVKFYWDWVPTPSGPSVQGICPDCFVNGAAGVDIASRTQPTFFEQRLAFVKGNPEADAKVVQFHIQSPTFHMWVDDRDRLTVREVIRCPSPRYGPQEKFLRHCDWAVRVEDGIATRVSKLVGGLGGKKSNGPIIIVK